MYSTTAVNLRRTVHAGLGYSAYGNNVSGSEEKIIPCIPVSLLNKNMKCMRENCHNWSICLDYVIMHGATPGITRSVNVSKARLYMARFE